jgi:hypothetical protein
LALEQKEMCYRGMAELHGETSSELSDVLTDLVVRRVVCVRGCGRFAIVCTCIHPPPRVLFSNGVLPGFPWQSQLCETPENNNKLGVEEG